MIDQDNSTAAERFNRSPRPLNFVRVRLYRGGQAEYVRELLSDEYDTLLEDLSTARAAGKQESDPEIVEITTNLRYLIRAKADIEAGMIEMAGPMDGQR